jgi:hypothetical protein
MTPDPAIYRELLDLERSITRLRARVTRAGLRDLDEALKVPHRAIAACADHVAPTDVPRWGDGSDPDRVWRGDDNETAAEPHLWEGN